MEEAERRGLLNLKTTADALPSFIADKNILLFTKHKIFTPAELRSRFEIQTEVYNKKLNIEARTMIDMIRRQILPAILSYSRDLAETALSKRSLSPDIDRSFETAVLGELSRCSASLLEHTTKLEKHLAEAAELSDLSEQAKFYASTILPVMDALRLSLIHIL